MAASEEVRRDTPDEVEVEGSDLLPDGTYAVTSAGKSKGCQHGKPERYPCGADLDPEHPVVVYSLDLYEDGDDVNQDYVALPACREHSPDDPGDGVHLLSGWRPLMRHADHDDKREAVLVCPGCGLVECVEHADLVQPMVGGPEVFHERRRSPDASEIEFTCPECDTAFTWGGEA